MDINPYEAPLSELAPAPQPIHRAVTLGWAALAIFVVGLLGTGLIAITNLLAVSLLVVR
jgi:hypothetical protein